MSNTTAYLVVSGRGTAAAVERYLYSPGKVISSIEQDGNVVALVEATTPLVGSDAAHELSYWASVQIDRLSSGLYGAQRLETVEQARAEFSALARVIRL